MDMSVFRDERDIFFCQNLVRNGGNKTAAARKAGFTASAAMKHSSKWVKETRKESLKPHCWDYVQEFRSERMAGFAQTQEKVLFNLSAWIDSDINDYLTVKNKVLKDTDNKIIARFPEVSLRKSLSAMTPRQRACIKSIKQSKSGGFELLLYNKADALKVITDLNGITAESLYTLKAQLAAEESGIAKDATPVEAQAAYLEQLKKY